MSMSATDPPNLDQPADQAPPQAVNAIPAWTTRSLTTEEVKQLLSPERKKEDARWTLARRLVTAYVALLAFSLVFPMVLLWIPHANGISVSDARDMLLALSGTLSGLVGILGFVMGYYFKELDKPAKNKSARKNKQKG